MLIGEATIENWTFARITKYAKVQFGLRHGWLPAHANPRGKPRIHGCLHENKAILLSSVWMLEGYQQPSCLQSKFELG
jgi:hypothetical protein